MPEDPAKGLVLQAITEAVRAHESYAWLAAALDQHRPISGPEPVEGAHESMPDRASTPAGRMAATAGQNAPVTQPALFDLLPEQTGA
ncbi:hypothetical protein [Actinomadura sp. 3N508]|uniref:hypothetical protein n=1 Tax=Actinomadura sp. 3N508 TaxID=3375153 RepID=UPI0037BD2246